jgi:DNA-binding XRE family transcriptional regulator
VPRQRKRLGLRAYSGVGANIQKRRIELGMDEIQVATLIDVSPETVASWEKGNIVPLRKYTPKLTEFLGFDPYEQRTAN